MAAAYRRNEQWRHEVTLGNTCVVITFDTMGESFQTVVTVVTAYEVLV